MRQFILGTDWWTDCDDAVALRLLARAVKRGEIRLLGVGINACMEQSVASLKGFLKAEGVEGVPVGIDLEANDFGGRLTYQMRLAAELAPDLTNADAEDPVRLYRRLLAEATEPVEILEIGFLQVVAALLKSGADDVSEKSGLELVREKVSKFWVMAGKWDADGEKENNFCRNERSRVAAQIFCELCPVPVTFLGFEVGYGVISGGKLGEDDFLHHVLVDHGSRDGRHSWDPMLVLMALIGDEAEAGYDVVVGHASVDPKDGANYFDRRADGLHRFVVKKKENAYYEQEIDRRI
jgi:hypothetical protein